MKLFRPYFELFFISKLCKSDHQKCCKFREGQPSWEEPISIQDLAGSERQTFCVFSRAGKVESGQSVETYRGEKLLIPRGKIKLPKHTVWRISLT